MTPLLDNLTELDVNPSPYELTADQASTARAAYERLGHHRLVRWSDLPKWQRAGYHRIALVDQIAAMQRVLQLSGAIDTQHEDLITAVTSTMASAGWAVSTPAEPALEGPAQDAGPAQDIDRMAVLEQLVRDVLQATAELLASPGRS